MSLFGSRESYVGVDIGNSAVKIVELENHKGRPKLLTYGYVEQQNDMLTSNAAESKQRIIDALKQVQAEAHTQSVNAVAALPTYTVFSSIIHLPLMPKKELASAVQWEAKKFVPMPVEEMILDWKILEDTVKTNYSANAGQAVIPGGAAATGPSTIQSEGKEFLKILLTAAPKDLVARYLEIFKEAKLNLVSLETESFALERALIGNDPTPVLLVDIGAAATTISVVVDGVPLINRSIDMGGRTITTSIANSLNIEVERAEQFKRDFGLVQQQGGGDQIPKRIEFMVSSIVNEMKYVLNMYQAQGDGAVQKVVLSGGSAWLPNVSQYLSTVLNMKVFIGDPWARVMYPLDVKTILQQIGPRMAVAAGCAMREIH